MDDLLCCVECGMPVAKQDVTRGIAKQIGDESCLCRECLKKQKSPQVRESRRQEAPREVSGRNPMTVTIIMSLVFYALLIGISFAPEASRVFSRAFDNLPMGIPGVVFARFLLTVMWLPFPFSVYHGMLIAEHAKEDGVRISRINYLLYFFTEAFRHAHLRRSVLIVLGNVLWFLAFAISWIYYADFKGV